MNNLTHQILLFTLLMFFSIGNGIAHGASLSQEEILLLKEYQEIFKPDDYLPIQCVGTCYVVSSGSHFEDLLSEKLNKDISISYLDYAEMVLEERLAKYFQHYFLIDSHDIKEIEKLDVFSGGNFAEFVANVTNKGLVISERKTKEQLDNEYQLLNELYQAIDNNARIAASQLREEVEAKSLEALRNVSSQLLTMLSPEKEYFTQIGIKFIDLIAELDNYLVGVGSGSTNVNAFQQSKVVELKLRQMTGKLQSSYEEAFFKDFGKYLKPLFDSRNEIIDNNVKKLREELAVNFKKARETVFYTQLKKTKIQFHPKSANNKFNFNIYGDIQSGQYGNINQSAVMSYWAIENSIITDGEGLGVQFLPDTINKIGRHQVSVIDSIKNNAGEVIFLVARNSWEKTASYRGYHFFHRSHFQYITAFEAFNLSDYDIQESDYIPRKHKTGIFARLSRCGSTFLSLILWK